MEPNVKLAETTTPDGGRLILYQQGGAFCIRLNGLQLMNSAATTSEALMGDLAAESLSGVTAPRVLIGGLGLGFTLRSVLEKVGASANVQVAELVPPVVDWNRRFMSGLNGALLEDPRVKVVVEDLWEVLRRAAPASYDVLLIDVDNGPKAFVHKQNVRLYRRSGLTLIAAALRPRGRAVFWSADPAPAFGQRLVAAGFAMQTVPVRFEASAERSAGLVYIADKRCAKKIACRHVAQEHYRV